MLLQLVGDLLRVGLTVCRSVRSLAAENLVLRRQLALSRERGCPMRRIDYGYPNQPGSSLEVV